jgi:Protein of unknown function (DUF1706)
MGQLNGGVFLLPFNLLSYHRAPSPTAVPRRASFMVGSTGKQTLLDLMELRRAAWDALISQFSEERLLQPGADGDWSVKDVIAHIAAYEDWTAQQLGASLRGEAPDEQEMAEMASQGWHDVDTRNRLTYEQRKDWPLDKVRSESEQAFNRLLQAVEALPDELLGKPQWWTSGRTLLDTIPGQSFEHYNQHIDLLRT